jgi:hypothetical protein
MPPTCRPHCAAPGFEVLERGNRSPDPMRRDLADFQDEQGPGVVDPFCFAGHGVQGGRGLNDLRPVGVDYRRERDAELYDLEAGAVLRRTEEAGAALSLVILDASRDSALRPTVPVPTCRVRQGALSGAPTDGSAWNGGADQRRRKIRGGSWGHIPENLRSANSEWVEPNGRDHGTGLRIARDLSP